MAKSKSGGTRSYIRGRIGADVYSIGKDGKGKKQQVVRSLAETVANPQTQAQMRGRMIMSTVMQAQSGLKVIIDHAFDGVQGVQPNLSEFIRQNYALIKADIASNPATGNAFGINKYQEKGVKQGAYVISDGIAVIPAAVELAAATAVVTIALDSDSMTIAGLKSKLGFGESDYLTIVGISASKGAVYSRLRVNPSAAETLEVSSANAAQLFAFEGNATPAVAVSGTNITVTLNDAAGNCGLIVSRAVSGGFIHNRCVLSTPNAPEFTANVALPTYPIGEQKFLNGGDIFGLSEESEVSNPSPEPVTMASISAATVSGYDVLNASTVTEVGSGSKQVAMTIANMDSNKSCEIWVAQDFQSSNTGEKLGDVPTDGSFTGTIEMSGTNTCYLWLRQDGNDVERTKGFVAIFDNTGD